MHIPDGFLDPRVAAATAIVSAAAVGYALRRADRELDDERVPLLGVTAAFIFAVQMLNFPVAGGTSGHLLGAGLAAILLGPWLACLVMAVVLTAQSLVFADGGVSALGANVLNMGVIGALTVGYLMVWARHLIPRTRAGFLAVVAGGAWLAVMAGAAATALELSISGTVPLGTVLPAMLGVHGLIGAGEAVITVAAVGAVLATRPDLVRIGSLEPPSRARVEGALARGVS
jgi:cobalt/nickel transport system permease protein